jgi:hypothetical protein
MQHSEADPRHGPALPELVPGVQLLETGASNGIEALHSLVIDAVLMRDGPAFWVDAGRHAVTSNLRALSPSDRVLDRIEIARGFTAYQHTALLRAVRYRLDERSPSVVVIPAVDAHYRGDDLQGSAGQEMLLAALADIARLAREVEVPVLLTRHIADDFSQPVTELAGRSIEYRETAFGPQFVGDDWETQIYPLDDGYVQTTLAFWERVLAERAVMHDVSDSPTTEVMARGAH